MQVLDTTSTVAPDYHQLQEVAIFLTQPNSLPPDMGLGARVQLVHQRTLQVACLLLLMRLLSAVHRRASALLQLPWKLVKDAPPLLPARPTPAAALYVSIGGADWSYRGYVSNSHPSDVLPLSWCACTDL